MSHNSEPNSFGKRTRRHVRVGGATLKAGASFVGARLVGEGSRAGNADILRIALGGLKGPLMKIAQLIATIPDFLPPEYAGELATLQSNAPSMGWPFVRRRMASELGAEWLSKFAHFEQAACAAASLGQVHRAAFHDGRALACKLQYPDMASTVEADLQQLKIIFGLFERFDKTIATDEAFAEIAERLREELDYTREAKAMALYGEILGGMKAAHVPFPLPELSTARLLTMTWMEGEPLIEAAATRNLEERNAIAMNMFKLWYLPFYHYGVIHGDPHLGNYTICKDNSINLLDFGCIRVFKPELVQAVIMLYQALRDDDEAKAVEAYRLWGFTDISKELLKALTLWARFIYAPILANGTRPIEETNATSTGRAIAGQVHRELKKLGGVSLPREFVLMDRASIGLGSVFLRLRAEVNWRELFDELTQDFDVEALSLRQATLLKKHRL